MLLYKHNIYLDIVNVYVGIVYHGEIESFVFYATLNSLWPFILYNVIHK